MKRILYLASFDIAQRTGGGLASLCYYNALCRIRPGMVDLVLPEECCCGIYENAVGLPKRNFIDFFFDFSMHRGRKFIKDFLHQHGREYDICVINDSRYGGDLMDIIHHYDIKIVMIHHNYEVEYCMSNKTWQTLHGIIPYWVSYIEKKAYRAADANCYLTQDDMKLITNAYGKSHGKAHLLGVFDYMNLEYRPTNSGILNQAIITGSLNDYQTYRSIQIFEKDYYQIVQRLYPHMNLIIAGRNPNKVILQFETRYKGNIKVIPNPKTMDDVIEQGSFVICPVCIGGGLKLRLMDGLKRGLPILVHKVSARGYDCFLGQPYFQVYESPESFESGLKNIVEYMKTNTAYKEEILTTYKRYFSFEAGVSRMNRIIENLN